MHAAALALTETLAAAPASTFPAPTALTDPTDPLPPREREIVELVARGLTSREIGERLYITKRTVDAHVARILQKLGVASRAEAAAWLAHLLPRLGAHAPRARRLLAGGSATILAA